MTEKISKTFFQVESISKHLFCTICQEVMEAPTRLGCGHSYCKECIYNWYKKTQTCPVCRVKILENQISKDLIACNIISELTVLCSNQVSAGCPWKGTLGQLESHNKVCFLNEKLLPDFLKLSVEGCERVSYAKTAEKYKVKAYSNQKTIGKFEDKSTDVFDVKLNAYKIINSLRQKQKQRVVVLKNKGCISENNTTPGNLVGVNSNSMNNININHNNNINTNNNIGTNNSLQISSTSKQLIHTQQQADEYYLKLAIELSKRSYAEEQHKNSLLRKNEYPIDENDVSGKKIKKN